MKNLLIKINELKITNYERKDDNFLLNIIIDINGQKDFLKKSYKLDKPDILAHDLINFIREDVKSKNRSELTNDIIGGIVIIRFGEDLEELETRLASFFKRFNELVKNFKNQGYRENYLMTYKTVDGFSQRF
jgi:hypothetical protein